jgi:uncharacterized repeat protein (TIGR03803 family)
MRLHHFQPAGFAVGLALACACGLAAQEKILWTFQVNGVDGQHPASNLIFDAKGNLYGTTDTGSKYGQGVVFELRLQANETWQEQILYAFGEGGSNDGANPQAGMVFDTHGNLFGTTLQGGSSGRGTVFELSPQANGSWTEQVIYQLGTAQNGLDGIDPEGNLAIDSSGNLYGVSEQGGGNDAGAVWELSPGTGGTWTFTPIYEFQGASMGDGQGPRGGLIFDKEGNLYGSAGGGALPCSCGMVFELSPQTGGKWKETILYSFLGSPNDASAPIGSLVFDSAGNLYGASINGGPDFIGTVYELSPGTSSWTETVLHAFSSANNGMDDGKYPPAGPVFDPLGNLYVATSYGGAIEGSTGGGTVIQLHPEAGGEWKETIVHSFPVTNDDGYYPNGGVLVDAGGNLYGTLYNGGANGAGIAYEIASPDLLAAPAISPGTGTYNAPQSVKITDTAQDVTVYYTTNGETPTTSSTKYSEPIEVTADETIRAFAAATGYISSKVASATYTFQAATPKLSVGTGIYAKSQTVIITDKTPHAVIHYTTSGKSPTSISAIYTKPIPVASSETIKAIAVESGYKNSAVASAAITIEKPAAKPVIKPAGGTVASGTIVKITDATRGAVIHYTTNGSVPKPTSPVFPGAGIKLKKPETIRALATAKGYLPSLPVTAKFTVK